MHYRTKFPENMNSKIKRALFIINECHFFLSHRLTTARAAKAAGFEVHVAAPDTHVWAPEGFSVEEITRAGFTYHRISLSRRGTNPIQELVTFVSIWRLLRNLRPELVHTLTIKPVLYGGIAARLSGVPALISAVTGLGQIFTERSFRASVVRWLVGRLYSLATGHVNGRVIVQNPEDGEQLAALGAVHKDRLKLIRGSGVALDQFRLTDDPGGKPIAILPARLIWEKGVQEFVDAARILRRRGVDARFALVGDSHSSNPRAVPVTDLQKFAEEGVEWWGRRADMADVFASVHLVVLPSTYGEGVPKVLIEAAASGRPVIATDIPGCREIVRHDVNGFLVPSHNPEALADAMGSLIADREKRQSFGQNGRKIAESDFDEHQVAASTIDVYRELLG